MLFRVLFSRLLLITCLLAVVIHADDMEEEEEAKYPLLKDKIEKASKVNGFLTLYKEGNQLYMELKQEDFEKDFFYFSSVSRGTLGGMVLPHWILDDKVLYFKKVENKILLFEKDLYHQAEKDTPTHKAVEKAYLDSLLHSFSIKAASEGEEAYLIGLNSFFFQAKNHAIPWWMAGAVKGLNSGSAFWSRVKGFPGNIELEVQMSVGNDSRGVSNQVRLYYSLVKREENSYKPRKADDRIGFFTQDHKDFSQLVHDDGMQRYITRWHLEKSDENSARSVVKKPVVFYLDKTIPFEYRQFVRAGVLEWNKAFEKVGYIGAIEVRLPESDQDWDPSDVRYSTISWAADSEGMAIGPSRVNPETGQILDADIIVSAGWITYMVREAELYGGSYGDADSTGGDSGKKWLFNQSKIGLEHRKQLARHGVYPCEAYVGLGASKEFAYLQAQFLRDLKGEKFLAWKEEFVGAYIKNLVMHEVGHTLGLRHNFKASAAISFENLKDKNWTLANQVNSSVMDYDDLNIAVDPEDQGKYMNDSLGAYDYLAIEYGYKPLEEKEEDKELATLASSLRERGLEYGTDEDLYFGSDPLIQVYDLGNDPVGAAKSRIEVIRRLLKSVESEMVTTGEPYFKFRRILSSLLNEYYSKSRKAASIIGGIYSNRDHVKDPSGRLPYVAVELSSQEKAMDYLRDFVFREQVFDIPTSLLAKARTNPWDWGANEPLSVDRFFQLVRASVLQDLMNFSLLRRIADFHETTQKDGMTLARLFEYLYSVVFGVFDSLQRGDEISLSEATMQLQRAYIDLLGKQITRGYALPGKGNLYLEHSLTMLEGKLGQFMKSSPVNSGFETAANFVHYRSLKDKIEKIRSAILIQN